MMTTVLAVWIVLGVVVLLVLYVIAAYNGLVRLRNRIDNAWSQIDVQLRRRYDLIPNLVETVKGYAAHERETFDSVTKARTEAIGAQGVAQQAEAENQITTALKSLFAQITSNKRRSALLIAGFVLLVVAVAWAVNTLLGLGLLGVLIALVIAAVGAFAAYWKSDSVALAMSHARPADPVQYARLHNL